MSRQRYFKFKMILEKSQCLKPRGENKGVVLRSQTILESSIQKSLYPEKQLKVFQLYLLKKLILKMQIFLSCPFKKINSKKCAF